MQSIVVDAGPLIALFDPSDRHHARALAFMQETRSAVLITNFLVIGEVAAMLSAYPKNLCSFLGWVANSIELDAETKKDMARIVAIMRKYADLPADIADASLVAMCERRQITAVAAIDSDFDVYRLHGKKKIENQWTRRA